MGELWYDGPTGTTTSPYTPQPRAGGYRRPVAPYQPRTPNTSGVNKMDNRRPTIDPNLAFHHPEYAGSDPAYLAWLAQADLSSADEVSRAKKRRGDANTAYDQALVDLATQATDSRRGLQTNMLSRGMFRSGEFGRRKDEMDSAFGQARTKAKSALDTNIGTIDDDQRRAIGALGMQGATQVSQAMLRDSVAAYEAQKKAAEAAAVPVAAPAAPQTYTPQPSHTPAPTNTPIARTAVDPRFRIPAAPKRPASGSTGALAQKRTGLQ